MRRITASFLVLLLTASFLVLPQCVEASYPVNIVDSYSEANHDVDRTMKALHPGGGADPSAVGQSFNATATYRLHSVSFYLKKTSTPVGDAYVVLYAHSGVYGTSSLPTGAALATSEPYAVSSLTTSSQLITFTFNDTNKYQLTAGEKYVITYQNPTAGTIDAAKYVSAGCDFSAPTHEGRYLYYANGAWSAYNTLDAIFYVYGSPIDHGYTFTGTYYENGTRAWGDAVTVTTTGTEYTDEFLVNGTSTQYYTPEPETFYWDIGGGYSRYIFSYGSENFTVTIPESTFYVYQFTVKDHTGKTGLGDCYLEAYRAINGTETLVERMKIYIGNPVPLNLVYGRTYHLQVLFADGSRYDWGYFMAGGVDEINLILKAVTFTDQAQILFNHIHVEATRTATVVTVNYLDDLNHTTWANTTIRIRNGAVVLEAPRTNSSYTVNWGGADADTGYTVTVAGEHTDYGAWGRSFILDPDETFPDPPSLAGIYGGVDSNFIAWVITMISLLTFSVAFRARGLVATMFIASMLNYLEWASWGYNWLAFGWLIAVGVALTAGGKT